MNKTFLCLFLVAYSISVSAIAAIIDNESKVSNSFKDTDTRLVWMDFGINNNQSFDFVTSQLEVGGIYYGWRLPSLSEVYTMWSNLANLANVSASFENPDYLGPGQLLAHDENTDGFSTDDSVWDPAFGFIGFNESTDIGNAFVTRNTALFQGSDGLSYVFYEDFYDTSADGVSHKDRIMIVDNINLDHVSGDIIFDMSTLLVYNVVAPASCIFILLALIANWFIAIRGSISMKVSRFNL